ncbi:serine acetyltransferase 1, chloroplastic [Trifolium repens]|nr:serine acetyltransferase 1, chloroplastic [Trifolium repens]
MKEVWSMDSPGTSSCLDGFSLPPTNLAGFPTAVVLGGTSIKTTEPAPILAPSPILTLPRMVAPAPMSTPSPILGWRSPPTFPVPPNVTWCRIDTLFPITAVSPTTTPVAWSNRTPFPILAAG